MCIFLGYSQTQSAYRCMDLQTKRFYLSRYVLFHETQTPISSFSAATFFSSSALSSLPIKSLPLPQPPPVRLDGPPASASPSSISPNSSPFVLPNSSSPVLPNFQKSSLATCSTVPPPSPSKLQPHPANPLISLRP
jgi:hypothetical protein